MGGVDKGKFESGGGWCELDENENEIGKWNGYVFLFAPDVMEVDYENFCSFWNVALNWLF